MKKVIFSLIAMSTMVVFAACNTGTDSDLNEDEMHDAVVGETTMMVNVMNASEDQPLSPGVFALHTADASMNFLDQVAPAEMESLAEWGDPAAFTEMLKGMESVGWTYTTDAPILPGESTTFEMVVNCDEGEVFFSGATMAVATNDGVAVVDAARLCDGKEVIQSDSEGYVFDMGFEENTEVGSGFAGGQPDPARGEENMTNGTATDPQGAVTEHEQVAGPIMMVEVRYKEEVAE